MSFTRQILIFVAIWAILIYIFFSKLYNTSSRSEQNEEIEKLNRALVYLEQTKSLDNELKHLLDEYTNDITSQDQKLLLIKKLNSALQEPNKNDMCMPNSQPVGVPSLEYEQMRRRVGTNIQELWNYMSAEMKKIEKNMKNEIGPQQSLKQLSNFIELAREHKR